MFSAVVPSADLPSAGVPLLVTPSTSSTSPPLPAPFIRENIMKEIKGFEDERYDNVHLITDSQLNVLGSLISCKEKGCDGFCDDITTNERWDASYDIICSKLYRLQHNKLLLSITLVISRVVF